MTTNLRALSMAVEIADAAIRAKAASSLVGCVKVARKTPWGRAVPITVLRAAIQATGMLTFIDR